MNDRELQPVTRPTLAEAVAAEIERQGLTVDPVLAPLLGLTRPKPVTS